MQINLIWDQSAYTAPGGFIIAMDYAAKQLDNLITNKMTLNFEVGWGEIGGTTPLSIGTLGEGGPVGGTTLTYADLVHQLTIQASNAADRSALAALPKTEPAGLPQRLYVSPSQEKAWGMIDSNGAEIDGVIGISNMYPFTFDPANRAVPGAFDAIGVDEHEITQAMGRIAGDGAFSLIDYAAPGKLGQGYFSTDGGKTNLGNFAPSGDVADWQNGPDSFNYVTFPGVENALTPVDAELMGALGFHLASDNVQIRCHHPHHMRFVDKDADDKCWHHRA